MSDGRTVAAVPDDLLDDRVRAHRDAALGRLEAAGALSGVDRVVAQGAEAEAADVRRAIDALCIGSDWAVDHLCRSPELLEHIVAAGEHCRTPSRAELDASCAAALADAGDDPDPAGPLGAALRAFRNRCMIGILLRDLSGRADLTETVRALSDLADVVIRQTLERLEARAVSEWGEPRHADGRRQKLMVLAMGKLGARELNLSSDVDLMFAYPEPGIVAGGTGITCQEFFTRLGRRLIALLDTRTPRGFVFRVDMRLRPFGDSGPLVQHAEALLDYYEEQGRDWERYALIKVRAVTGGPREAAALMGGLRPFVFRRYLDFGAIDALREMKSMIRREVRRRGLQDDVKLGEGGIREIEFVAQVFQLIHGGRDRSLQTRALLDVLPQLETTGLMAADDVEVLTAAYRHLRTVEHRLQAVADAQTQRLPSDDLPRARLAASVGCASIAAFDADLTHHRDEVARCFAALIRPIEAGEGEGGRDLEPWLDLWAAVDDAPLAEAETAEAHVDACRRRLEEAGFGDVDAALARLRELAARREEVVRQDVGRARLDALMPRLLRAVAGASDPDLALERTLRLVDAVLRRTAYLVLLNENPSALEQLVKLSAGSERIAAALVRHPILLDELLDVRQFYTVPTREALAAELADMLTDIPEEDLEAQMEQLRYFKVATELRVAACELTDVLPLMKVSDTLTWLAEVILEQAVQLAWRETVAQYGPPAGSDGEASDLAFGVVGYGKLGGFELGWGSDLDLVFLHDLPAAGTTLGERSVANGQFLARTAQRLIHLLSTRTFTGALYEVDLRLRPSGRSGVLVSGVDAFAAYQRDEAWIWEHQALVRARSVAGAPSVLEAFERVRREVLGQDRDRDALRHSIVEMRDRMLAEHGLKRGAEAAPSAAELNLKQAPGAVVDIEFMVQFLVLGWARAHPDLLLYTDAIRGLETAAKAGLLAEADAQALIESYKALRAEAHRKALQDQPARSDRPDLVERAAQVSRIWSGLMMPTPEGAADAGAE